MRIAQVAPLYESVPPQLYGGTERVVSYLTEELVRLGHNVTLFASGDSVTQARLEASCSRALRLDLRCCDTLAPHMRMLSQVYQRAQEFDLIHCHTDYLGLPLTRTTTIPTIITLHGRLDIPEIIPLYNDYPEVRLVSISNAQRIPLAHPNWVATVYHGLPPDLHSFHPRGGSYLLFLGRISCEKRPDSAIRVACRAGVPLRIAAKIDRVDREYFETTIRPLLNHPLIEFLGEVNEQQKQILLGNALALLFPIDWPEPFGLVMLEALASGTPVIARSRGSVPEVLCDGVTGLLCESEDEMVEAVHRVAALDRATCRREFEQRFTVQIMVQNYLKVYEAALNARASFPYTASDTRWSQWLYSPDGTEEVSVGAQGAPVTTMLPSK
jgi:glycosyltransferase involved in cell wall biosynthesis